MYAPNGSHDRVDPTDLLPRPASRNDGYDLGARFDALKASLREDPDHARARISDLRTAVVPATGARPPSRHGDAAAVVTPHPAVDAPDEVAPVVSHGGRPRGGPSRDGSHSIMIRVLVIALVLLIVGAVAFTAGRQIGTPVQSAAPQDLAPDEVVEPQPAAVVSEARQVVEDRAAGTTESTAIPAPRSVSSGAVEAAAAGALAAAGYPDLAVEFHDGTLELAGVVAAHDLIDGYFAHVAEVEAVVADIDAVDHVTSHLYLRGDEARLREELGAISAGGALVFDTDSVALSAEATEALGRAADVILSHPGLRVLVAGRTDARGNADANAVLAAERAQAVVAHLVSLGVPITRLQVASYGELFPEEGATDAESRRVDFEVAP